MEVLQQTPREYNAFSEEGAEIQGLPGLTSYGGIAPATLLDGGEIVILAMRPSMWFLILVSVRWLLAAAAVILAAPLIVGVYPAFTERALTQAALVVTAARLIVALLQWSSRLFVLTNRRVMCYQGIHQVAIFEASLVQVRNTYVRVGRFEKTLNVGSIGFSLKGTEKVDTWWNQIADPHETHERVRRAIENALDNHLPY